MEVRTPDFAPKRDAWRNEKRDAYLKENYFVDPAILADALGHDVCFIELRLRQLGLRKCRNKEGR